MYTGNVVTLLVECKFSVIKDVSLVVSKQSTSFFLMNYFFFYSTEWTD
jgi:hypothetical protein